MGTLPAGMPGVPVVYYAIATDGAGNTLQGPNLSFTDRYLTVDAGTDTVIGPGGHVVRTLASNHFTTRISELLVNRGGTGTQTTFAPSLPQTGTADMIELTNVGNSINDLSNAIIQTGTPGFGPGGGTTTVYSLTLPQGTRLAPGQTLVAVAGTGTNNAAARVFYFNGTTPTDVLTTFQGGAVALLDPNGNLADYVSYGNFSIANGFAGATAADFAGSVILGAGGPGGNNAAGFQLTGADANNATAYTVATATATTTLARPTPWPWAPSTPPPAGPPAQACP